METIRIVEEDYHMALKAEEKLIRKQGQQGRGRSHPRGKIVAQEKFQKPKEEWKKPHTRIERGGNSQRGKPYIEQRGQHTEHRGDYAGNNTFPRTRGRGRGRGGVITCFTCRKNGHKSYECPNKNKESG